MDRYEKINFKQVYINGIRDLEEDTQKNYSSTFNNFIDYFNPENLDDILTILLDDIKKYIENIKKDNGENLSISSKNVYKKQIAKFFDVCRLQIPNMQLRQELFFFGSEIKSIRFGKDFSKNEKIDVENTINRLEIIRQRKYKKNIKIDTADRDIFICSLMLYCGLRRREATLITKDCIDLENQKFEKIDTKGRKILTFNIPDTVVENYNNYINSDFYKKNCDDSNILIFNKNGVQMDAKSMNKILEKYDISDTKTHSFKKAYSTIAFRLGLVQKLERATENARMATGHASGGTTKKYYIQDDVVHSLKDMNKIAEKINSYITEEC